MRKKSAWAGLVEVRNLPGQSVLGVDRGGHVTIIAYAKDEKEYLELVRCTLRSEGLELVSAEEIELCDERIANYEVSNEFRERAAKVDSNDPVSIMVIHTFSIDAGA